MTTLIVSLDVHELSYVVYKGANKIDSGGVDLFPDEKGTVSPDLVHPAMDAFMADNAEIFVQAQRILMQKQELVDGDETNSINRILMQSMIQGRYRCKTVLLLE